MQPMTVKEIVAAVDGVWLNPWEGDPVISSVCTDSRKITPGCLFLPWVGERFDGHDFIDAALDAGAAGCRCGPETGNFCMSWGRFSICGRRRRRSTGV